MGTPKTLEANRKKYNLPCLGAAHTNVANTTIEVTGVRKTGTQVLAQRDDQFHLGSLTKAFTATLIAVLVREGLLSWDSTLGELLGDDETLFPQEGKGQMHALHVETTLKMLSSHRSGLSVPTGLRPGYVYGFYAKDLLPHEARTRAMKDALTKAPSKRRGTFTYDNINYVILGGIIDRYCNSTYEFVMTEKLFKPLGMKNTGFGPTYQSDENAVDNPWPHVPNPIPTLPAIPVSMLSMKYRDLPNVLNSAGLVHCSLEDYTKFLLLHIRGFRHHERSEEEREETLGLTKEDFVFLHKPFDPNAEGESRYTFGGWIRPKPADNSPENYSIYHEGSTFYNCSRARIDFTEETGEGYICCANRSFWNGWAVHRDVVKGLRFGDVILKDSLEKETTTNPVLEMQDMTENADVDEDARRLDDATKAVEELEMKEHESEGMNQKDKKMEEALDTTTKKGEDVSHDDEVDEIGESDDFVRVEREWH